MAFANLMRAGLLVLALSAPIVGRAAELEPPNPPNCDLTVMISGAFNPPYQILAPAFEEGRGKALCTVYGPSLGDTPTAIPNRLARGEPADVVILARTSLDDLLARRLVAAGSDVDLVNSYMGLAVKAGAPRPDISTDAAFKATLINAKSLVYSISASGVYLTTEVFPRMGIAEVMKPKVRQMPGTPVALEVAAGRAELGFQQLSELMAVPGVDVVGPIPAPWQRMTVFSAGVAARSAHPQEARALIAYLTSPAAWPTIRAAGLEPSSAPR